MSISLSSTVEDILNLKKNEIQSFLRSVNAKLTGTKHELAQRAYILILRSKEDFRY
jgi:hypothetical protein